MAIELGSELIALRRNILAMGAAVEQRVNQAIEALLTHEPDLAREVRGGDAEIDTMEVEIEAECLRILALLQPVASDLRFVLAVLRINNELERVGDLARSLAKRAIDLSKLKATTMPPALTTMAYETRRMFSDALAALAENGAGLARRVRCADDRVDDLQKEIFRWAQTEIHADVDVTAAALDFLSVARKLERIADLATNIAEDVIFLTEGTVVRHADPSEPA